jgi:hypothetical protein
LAFVITACAPEDPEQTLEQIRDGAIRVGISHAPPWVNSEASPPEGIEVGLVQELARSLGTRVEWRQAGPEELFQQLERFEIDLFIAGLEAKTPWKSRVALTRPWLTLETERGKEEHVWALPPGENGWLLEVERFLEANKARAQQLHEAAH